MTDDELRRQAHKVAEALGLGRELPRYQCGRCGNKWLVEDMPRCPECGEYEDVAHIGMEFSAVDLLTEAGGGALQTALLSVENENDIPALHVGFEHDFSDLDGYRVRANINHAGHLPESSGFHDAWPGALVLAASAALGAGWLWELVHDTN
jgi:hypothetical protein